MPAVVDPRVSHGIGLLAVSAAVVLSWQAVYQPAAHQLHQWRERLSALRQQVEEADELLRSAEGEATWIANQQHQLVELMARIPPSHDMPRLLDTLLDRVARANLKLVNVNQGTMEPAKDAHNNPILLEGASCLGLPVVLSVEGRFREVVALLARVVSLEFPGLVTIERVHLVQKDSLSGTLSASLQLVLYVVGS